MASETEPMEQSEPRYPKLSEEQKDRLLGELKKTHPQVIAKPKIEAKPQEESATAQQSSAAEPHPEGPDEFLDALAKGVPPPERFRHHPRPSDGKIHVLYTDNSPDNPRLMAMNQALKELREERAAASGTSSGETQS